MRRWTKHLLAASCLLCLLLSAAVCVLWVRSLHGQDNLEWTYDRWLPDRSAASTQVLLTSGNRLWLHVMWGQAPPFNGSLVYGYYIRADQSGSTPRLRVHHLAHPKLRGWLGPIDPDLGTAGIGPLRWQTHARFMPIHGDDHRSLRIGVSHWLIALLLLIPPATWIVRFRRSRRSRQPGLCPTCGYDLRATPHRCPECGGVPPSTHLIPLRQRSGRQHA